MKKKAKAAVSGGETLDADRDVVSAVAEDSEDLDLSVLSDDEPEALESDGDEVSEVSEDFEDSEESDESEDAEDAEELDEEDELEGDADELEDEAEDAKASRRDLKVEKRISKEVARRKAAEEQARRHEAELKALRDELAERSAGSKFESISDLSGVVKARKELRRELDLVEEGIDRGELEVNGKTYETETLRKWRREIREELEDVLPAVERRILRREEVNREQVSRVYPELLDDSSEVRKAAEKLFERLPGLKRDPEALLLVGDLLRGRKLRMAVAKKPQKKGSLEGRRRAPVDPGKGGDSRRVVRSPRGRDEDADFMGRMARAAEARGFV